MTTRLQLLTLEDVRDKPIPQREGNSTALDYHAIPIDVDGAHNGEQVVDLAAGYGVACRSAYAQALAPYYRSFASAPKTVYVRRSVAEKLAIVNELLEPYGVGLLALDGYRPIELQQELWQHFIEQGRRSLTNPTDEELVKFAGTYCSDPRGFRADDWRTWPVHNTGGAIDLTLRRLSDGQEMYMGSIFDDADAVSFTRHYENPELTSQSALEARRNRRLLFWGMRAQEFVNYPCEWWHFDHGTQMAVMNGGLHCNAHYGRAVLTQK